MSVFRIALRPPVTMYFDFRTNKFPTLFFWNNKFICINSKSVFFQSLVSKGIVKIGDLVTVKNQFIFRCNQGRVNFSPKEIFDLLSLVDAIPAPWRQSLKINGYLNKSPFVIQDQIQIVLNNQEASIIEATFKKVYRESLELSLHRQLTESLMKASVESVWTGRKFTVCLI